MQVKRINSTIVSLFALLLPFKTHTCTHFVLFIVLMNVLQIGQIFVKRSSLISVHAVSSSER